GHRRSGSVMPGVPLPVRVVASPPTTAARFSADMTTDSGGADPMGLFSRMRPTPLDGVDLVLADLDGVVYAGPGALPHAVDSLSRAAEGRRLAFITNNASRRDTTVAAHL